MSHQMPSSADDPAAFALRLTCPPRSILEETRMLPGMAFARHGPLGLRVDREITGDPVSPNTICCGNLTRTSIDDPAAFSLRLTVPEGIFLAAPTCSPGQHLHGMGPRDFRRIRKITIDPFSPNVVRCCNVRGHLSMILLLLALRLT